MSRINYQKIYRKNQEDWKALTEEPQKYEALLAGHYSDCNHFVYELLQNAEDEMATKAVIEYNTDRLVFYHNGDPFDEDDVIGVSSMLMGTKDRNDAQTIGRFGMGFKSVFKYTCEPEIYSDDEAFIIKNYLLPEEIQNTWDFQTQKRKLIYPDVNNKSYQPFVDEQHLTRIVIPFIKRDREGKKVDISGEDVLDKLESLSAVTLLFLTNIQELYWINKETGRYVHIVLSYTKGDPRRLSCRKTTSDDGGKTESAYYIKYKKVFDHPEMKSAEVSVAYRINRGRIVDETEDSPIHVYFPTRDMTELPFLIHGSFETAVSREKLMTPSSFNDDLFEQLRDLIADSMVDLADRKLINQSFIRHILFTAFDDEDKNGTIPGLKDKITNVFLNRGLIPDREGKYCAAEELKIPVPYQIAEFKTSLLFKESFSDSDHFVAFGNDADSNFTEYYSWLKNDLHIPIFDLNDWSKKLCSLSKQKVSTSKESEELKRFYRLLDNIQRNAQDNVGKSLIEYYGISYFYMESYAQRTNNCLKKAWPQLKKAPVIINEDSFLIPAYDNNTLAVYFSASSKYRNLNSALIVNKQFSSEFETLFKDGFKIEEFDNFRYIKEKIIKKYKSDDDYVHFDDVDNSDYENIEDIRQLLDLIDELHNNAEVIEFLEDADCIRIKTEDGSKSYASPKRVFTTTSDEGIDLVAYYASLDFDDEEDYYHYCVDSDFYESYGIHVSELKKLGLITSPVEDGLRKDHTGTGDGYWDALGEFCPNISIDYLVENLDFIELHPNEDLAKRKSAEILKLLLGISRKLSGTIRKRKINPYETHEEAFIKHRISLYSWLFDKEGNLQRPTRLSRYDLDEKIYRDLPNDKETYRILGFIEKEADSQIDTFEKVDALNERDQRILLDRLAKKFGVSIQSDSDNETNRETMEFGWFNPQFISEEFPQRTVRNRDSLIKHVQQEFFFADPTRYQQVLRQIRTSRSSSSIREYLTDMYTNESDMQICQICQKPIEFMECTEIANFGIEMPQLNLCLCRNCHSKYRQIRDKNKADYKEKIQGFFLEMQAEDPNENYTIPLTSELTLRFTQTHLAEIKEILLLLKEYGTPNKDEYKDGSNSVESNGNASSLNTGTRLQEKSKEAVKNQTKLVEKNSNSSNNEKQSTSKSQKKVEIGALVQHKIYGNGEITFISGSFMGVKFNSGVVKKFFLSDAFKSGFLVFR